MSYFMIKRIITAGVVMSLAGAALAWAQPPEEEDPLEALERAVDELQRPPDPTVVPPAEPRPGVPRLRLVDISVDVMAAVGSSTEDDESLQNLQGGHHDPRKRGFTLQQVELSLTGAVDPYFWGEVHLLFFVDPLEGESEFELEEAFLVTQAMPFGFQAKFGHYLTEFGRINPRHPHAWHWLDQPVVATRFFGPDMMRSTGARLSWLAPMPWYSELFAGVQNAEGEAMVSFLASDEVFDERPIAGLPFDEREVHTIKDFMYNVRWANAWDFTDELSGMVGLSGAFGPNPAEGRTTIYGIDLVAVYRPEGHFRGWPFLRWETELMQRNYQVREAVNVDRTTLRDWGGYTQLLWGFEPGWATGLRYEYATARGEGAIPRDEDPFRDRRHRISPLLIYHPSEFSRLRLQYNYDRAQHLEARDAHSVWFGVEFLYGPHPVHEY